MVARKNINALTELGARRRALRAELEAIDEDINKALNKTYKEGYTWPELMEASSLSLGTLRVRLQKLGLTDPTAATRRPESTPVARERKAAQRTARTAN
ncbi:hypothetical protein ACJEDT_12265 [Rhodococcoides fascians]|jgi:hypothetical protein|uniref:hypothetical protein n=1 Tax=Rhodococcoides fascians TaxID=1828 RepID=UPI00050C9AEC|nr:hypothetical protein [Rhodococcus fascians]